MKYRLSFIFLIISQLTAININAAPLRSAVSNGVTPSYSQPELFNPTIESSDCYVDLLQLSGNEASYEVNYTSDDPILFVSLGNGRISSFERQTDGSAAKIIFTAQKIEGVSLAVNLKIFTLSLLDITIQAPGLDQALAGSYFDSIESSMPTAPFISNQGFRGLYFTFNSGSVGLSDTLRAYFTNDALKFINDNKVLSLKKLRIIMSRNFAFYEVISGAVESVAGGIIISIPFTVTEEIRSAQINLSALGLTGIYVPKKVSRKNSFYLSAVVKDCTDGSEIKIERQLSGESDFKKFKTLRLEACQSSILTKLNTSAKYRFKFGKKTYTKSVTIK